MPRYEEPFGAYLNRKRRSKQLTLCDVALTTGIDIAVLVEYELGRRCAPDIKTLHLLSKGLGLDDEERYRLFMKAQTSWREGPYDLARYLGLTDWVGREVNSSDIKVASQRWRSHNTAPRAKRLDSSRRMNNHMADSLREDDINQKRENEAKRNPFRSSVHVRTAHTDGGRDVPREFWTESSSPIRIEGISEIQRFYDDPSGDSVTMYTCWVHRQPFTLTERAGGWYLEWSPIVGSADGLAAE